MKSYICVFVSLTVKAGHLESISDLTTEAFLASLRWFIARRGKPSCITSDHGTNFVGAARELKELIEFLSHQKTQGIFVRLNTSPGSLFLNAPHTLVASGRQPSKASRPICAVSLETLSLHYFEELATVLTQIEAVLNSRPLTPLSCNDDGVDALTLGHFMIAWLSC